MKTLVLFRHGKSSWDHPLDDIDRPLILKGIKRIVNVSIKNKNIYLSNNLKINVVKETAKIKRLSPLITLKKARINSLEVTNNDIFFAIKGKKNDGNKFVTQSFKRKASLAVVNKIQNKFNNNRQIKVKNTLKFLTNVS